MPCGGIYPSQLSDRYTCWYCHLKGPDHWVEEWDAPLHKACIAPFLRTEEGAIVLAHKHFIQIGDQILLEEGGILMDPDETLRLIRDAVRDAKYREDAACANDPSHHARRARTFDHEDPLIELVKHFDALDEWLSKGGFLPADWSKNR